MNIKDFLAQQKYGPVLSVVCVAVALLALAMSWLVAISPTDSDASSHREAPLISGDPTADNLDVYAFVSPDLTNTVTLIANWIPFEEPGGGPNFYHFDPNARYLIKIDRNGDTLEDLTYEWTFEKPAPTNPNTFLYNVGQITSINDGDYNLRQYYTVTKIISGGATSVVVPRTLMPPDNIGPRSIPNYATNIEGDGSFIKNCGANCKEFTGQRDDPFYVDVGSIFDLAGLRPFNNLHDISLPVAAGQDVLAGYNMHTTAIQVPISDLVTGACNLADATDKDCVIGVWSTAERRTTITYGGGNVSGSGAFAQVSRLGNPLVNEAVMSLALKDVFNSVPPSVDRTVPAVVARVTDPELAVLEDNLYDALATIDKTGRQDLVTVFLTGIPSAPGYPMTTQQANSAATPSEQLRLNVVIKPTKPACRGDQLGLFNDDPVDGDDLTAWPNGRRLEDDVTDMALRAVAQGYGPVINGVFGGLVPQFKNLSPNNLLGDGVEFQDIVKCKSSFPYMGTPYSGYENSHDVSLSSSYLPQIRKDSN